jgi:hypothetical protein
MIQCGRATARTPSRWRHLQSRKRIRPLIVLGRVMSLEASWWRLMAIKASSSWHGSIR